MGLEGEDQPVLMPPRRAGPANLDLGSVGRVVPGVGLDVGIPGRNNSEWALRGGGVTLTTWSNPFSSHVRRPGRRRGSRACNLTLRDALAAPRNNGRPSPDPADVISETARRDE